MNTTPANKIPPDMVRSSGLFYVGHRLSVECWKVLPNSRNAKGVDWLLCNQNDEVKHSVKVRALSKRAPVPLGKTLDNLLADFFIVCVGANNPNPGCFILKPKEVRGLVFQDKFRQHWLQPDAYDSDDFRERWDRIGRGD